MNYLRRADRFYKFRSKGFAFSADGMNNPYQFIHKGNHGLFITAKLLFFAKEIFSEAWIPFNYTCCHLKQGISKVRASLFRDTHPELILTGLFYHWICACILYKLFMSGEILYILNFSKKECCKSFRDTFYRRDKLQLLMLVFVYLIGKHLLKSLYLWLKEEEFFNIEGKDFSIVGVLNSDRCFSELDEVLWLKRGIFKQYMKGDMGEDIKVFFSLREKHTKCIFDLSFSGGKFTFKLLDKMGKVAELRVGMRLFEELRIGQSKESEDFGIFFIGLRGVVGRDKPEEPVNELRIYEVDISVMRQEEVIEGNVKSSRGFHNNNRFSKRAKQIKKIREPFTRHRIIARRDSFSILIKDTEMEILLRDINTNKVFHGTTSLYRDFKSLTLSSRVARAFVAQPTHWELRDRGADSLGGLEAHKLWSPCPSLILPISNMPCVYILLQEVRA